MARRIRVIAPAKINLCLDVLCRRADGYHDLDTLFQAVGLADELVLAPSTGADSDQLAVSGPFGDGVPADGRNLAMRAVALLRRRFGARVPPLAIELHKRIPSEAGLGGGSSDGAAALVGLNSLFDLQLADSEVEALALELGSDCPFFLRGGTQRGGGRGERLSSVARRRSFGVVIAVPAGGVSTREAFAGLAGHDLGGSSNVAEVVWWLGATEGPPIPREACRNAFQRSVAARHPGVAATLDRLDLIGASPALLSGSGSACFGIFPSLAEAEAALARLGDLSFRLAVAAEPIDGGVVVETDE